MWSQPSIKQSVAKGGDVDATIGTAPVQATYFWPFQAHANMGPGCTVVDVRDDGVTVWSGTQKTHALRQGMSKLLNVPLEKVRVVWASDAGSYGRGGLGRIRCRGSVSLARHRPAGARAIDAHR